MVSDALSGDRTIGMVLVRGVDGPIEPAPPESPDHPEVYPVGCAGRIVQHEKFEDGRRMIVLQGTTKFRVRRETDGDEPYRVAEIQALYEAPPPADRVREWKAELESVIKEYIQALDGDASMLAEAFDKLQLEGLVNYLSASLPFDAVEKQGLLECPMVERRYERLSDIVRFKTAEVRLGLDAKRDTDA
jgi:Lon protease-like protein